ncbi:MAG: DUF4019 domain-containing protein [Puniceicoccales bacterium]
MKIRPMCSLSRLCAVLVFALLATPAWALPVREVAGREAVDAWLKLVDNGEYAESWKATAPLFRESIKQQEWVELIGKVRSPLGKVESRTLKALFITDELPDAPPGEYLVAQFQTKFAGREDMAIETITPMWDSDAQAWYVCGYYIK